MKTIQHRAPTWVLWTLGVIATGAFVATWGGWVGLGSLTGFGIIKPLPGLVDTLTVDSSITLPLGVEAYGFLAIGAWLSGWAPTERAQKFAMVSGLFSIVVGMSAQAAYHVLTIEPGSTVPRLVVVAVACVPNTVLGLGSILAHLLRLEVQGEPQPKPRRIQKAVQKVRANLDLVLEEVTGEREHQERYPIQEAAAIQNPIQDEVQVQDIPVRVQPSSTVDPDIREKALVLIQRAEDEGKRYGRSRLMADLDITEATAKNLIREVRAQLQVQEPPR